MSRGGKRILQWACAQPPDSTTGVVLSCAHPSPCLSVVSSTFKSFDLNTVLALMLFPCHLSVEEIICPVEFPTVRLNFCSFVEHVLLYFVFSLHNLSWKSFHLCSESSSSYFVVSQYLVVCVPYLIQPISCAWAFREFPIFCDDRWCCNV